MSLLMTNLYKYLTKPFHCRTFKFSLFVVGFLWSSVAYGETYALDSPGKWNLWDVPTGTVRVLDRGRIELVKFDKSINAARNASSFVHPTQKRGEVRGGIWRAGSNVADAELIIDGDVGTYWKPSERDQLVDWSIDIDLGRAVLAREINLIFPTEDGSVRPLVQFSVFISTGSRIKSQDDVFRYRKVFETTKPNTATSLRIPMVGDVLDTTRIIDAGLGVDFSAEQKYRVVRFVRIVVDEATDGAALSEVEVLAAGDNVSLGVLERGGAFDFGLLARDPQNMFDGNMDTFAVIVTAGNTKGGWREGGMWWQVDLGAQFWIDEIFMYFQDRGEALSSFLFEGLHQGRGFNILTSDGRRTTGGELDYEQLLREEIAIDSPLARDRQVRHIRYLFAPRRVRYLFWHGHEDNGWFSKPMEFMLFSPGYPAEVVLRSDFIDLGALSGDGRPKAIRSLNWEAELPAQTKIRLRSRSGNNLGEVYTFYDRTGAETTETKWTSSPKVLRGKVDTTIVVGYDWGEWSNFYQISGETFQSETPRRYIQLELIMSTEDPSVAPVLDRLAIEYEDALVQRAVGRVLPRQASVNEETRFSYTLWPTSDSQDSGFNRLRLRMPSPVRDDDLNVRVDGVEQALTEVINTDSLLTISLPERVFSDSLVVEFTTRVVDNATLFSVDVGDSERLGLWQAVEEVERQANIVYLPDVVSSDVLIGDLSVAPGAFTPNGDGVNDEVDIRFTVYKVDRPVPEVTICDMSGRVVATLSETGATSAKHYRWDGLMDNGHMATPGMYLCKINVGAASGNDSVVRSLALAY